jgi:SSS family solute:Na+ symporter
MEAHYGKSSRIVTGLLSVALCTGILGAQAVAIGTVVNATLDVPPTLAIAIGMVVTVLYSTFGGAWAVIQTDMLQFVFLGVLIPLTLLYGLHAVGGPEYLWSALPSDHMSFLGDYSIATFIGLFAAFLLGETLVPPYAQRTFATPDSSHARKGFVAAGVFSFFFYFISASIGAVAYLLYPDIAPEAAIPTVATELLPAGLFGLLVAALLAVVMSTASSYLNSSAVVFSEDLYRPLAAKQVSARGRLRLERLTSVLVGAGATVFALTVPSIVDALLYSYTLWAPTMIVPLLGAVLFGISSKPAALWGIAAGAVVTVVWQWVLGSPLGLDGLIPGVLANLAVYSAVALTTRKSYPRKRASELSTNTVGAH